MSRNQLADATSPYLLLHKDNPVHWRPWGQEALDEAKSSGKPIMLSIGFTACHGCELMNRDSFSDPLVAAVMNENFVCIKVDREERPDIDQVYQASLTLLTGGKGGWPVTGFLTPDGDMFYAGTYFPPVDRPDSPSFSTLLNAVLKLRADEPQNIDRMIARVNEQYATNWNRDMRAQLAQAPIDEAALRIGQTYDMFYGGLQGPSKFPNYAHVELMLRAYLRTGTMQFNALAQTTLTALCMGGIYDHVGGGIMRNAADDRWIVPHFEKMLIDNAQYIELLTLAWQLDRNPLYLARVEETIAWLQRDMMVDNAFASSIASDSDGEEGKFYVWSEAEIDAALAGTFSQKFKAIYGVTSQGNYNGRNVLARSSGLAMFNLNKADEVLLAKQREMLLAERGKRVAPVRDDKVLADWNGMAIAALATAGTVMRRTDWVLAAMRAFDFVEKALGDGDRLYHSWRNGKRQHIGFSDDYAHMARAAMSLWENTQDPRYLERCKAWVRTLNEHFWDSSFGGYFFTADDSDPLVARPRTSLDLFQPSANGIMPAVLAKLAYLTGDDAYRNACNQLLEAFAGQIGSAYISMASYLNSMETVVAGLQIVVIGPLTNPKTHELLSAVMGRALPNKLLFRVESAQELPQGHPAYGKPMDGGRPTAYICQRNICSNPVTNPVTLSQALQLPQRAQPQQQMPQPAGRA